MGRRQQTQRLLGAGACIGADPRARREASTSGLKGFKGLLPVPTNLDQSDFFASSSSYQLRRKTLPR